MTDCIIKLKDYVESSTNLLKKTAAEIEKMRGKAVQQSYTTTKLQEDLTDSNKKNIDALELTFDRKTSEAVDKLSDKLLENTCTPTADENPDICTRHYGQKGR